jgi:hypothetical protein
MPTEYSGEAKWRFKASLGSVRRLLDKVEALVSAEVDRVAWSYRLIVKKPSATLTGESLSDFDGDVDEAIWTHLNFGDITCRGYPAASTRSISVTVTVGWPTDKTTSFKVHGTRRTQVEGITAQLKEAGEDILESELTQPARTPSVEPPHVPVPTPAPAPSPRASSARWWENTVVQGIALFAAVAGLVAFGVLLAH